MQKAFSLLNFQPFSISDMRGIFHIVLLFIVAHFCTTGSIYGQYYNTIEKYLNANRHIGVYGGAYSFEIKGDKQLDYSINRFGTSGLVTETNFMISDPANGSLLYYTLTYQNPDSVNFYTTKIYNSRHEVIEGAVFNYTRAITEMMHFSIIAPAFDNDYLFYIFYYTNADRWGTVFNLCYAVLDMRANNGDGRIISKDNILQRNLIRQFQRGVIPGNDCNIWTLFLSEKDQKIYTYEIRSNGINSTPIVSDIALRSHFEQSDNPVFKIAPDRQTLFMSSTANTPTEDPSLGAYLQYLYFWKFNVDDGRVSDQLVVKTNYRSLFVPFTNYEFLNHNQIIYSLNSLTKFNTQVILIDLKEYNEAYILDNLKTLNNTNPSRHFAEYKKYHNHLYMLNPRIRKNEPPDPTYFTVYGTLSALSFEDVEKDRPPTPMNFNEEEALPYFLNEPIYLNNNFFSYEIIYPLPYQQIFTNAIHVSTHCFNEPQDIILSPSRGDGGFEWDDGSTGRERTVHRPGTYWVRYPHKCIVLVDSFYVEDVFEDIPVRNIDTIVCEQHLPLTLAYPDIVDSIRMDNYTVQDNRIGITGEGQYPILLFQKNCTTTAHIRVTQEKCPCDLFAPNAFSPNGDGLNDYFKPVTLNGCVPEQYILRIFDRFGSLVYISYSENDPGWDGSLNNKQMPAGVYFYQFLFRDSYTGKEFYYKGDFTLIR